jgi:transposase InsO family protein
LISSDKPIKISIDKLCLFTVDKDANIYIITMVDCFSRYVELYQAADCTAEAVARAIVDHFFLFGAPEIVLSDSGS